MPARVLLLLVLCLGLAAPAFCAPAPFHRGDQPEQAPVLLSGWLPPDREVGAAGELRVIVTRRDWDAACEAWGLRDAPKVDFRTHLLAAYVAGVYGTKIDFRLGRGGDLRAVAE